MPSFFSDIQGFFSARYDGRHLGLIVREIGKRHPAPFLSFISQACDVPRRHFKKARFEVEYHFRGRKSNCRADLAIFADETDIEPVVLIEIKYFDKPHDEQLPDYLAWKNADKSKSRRVLVLSREPLVEDGIPVRRWGEFAKFLKKQRHQSDLISMLVEYLEEEGIVVQNINSKALIGFYKRLLCGPQGAGVLASNIQGPAELSKLLKNMRLLTQPIDLYFKGALFRAGQKVDGVDFSTSSRIATIDFTVRNRCKMRAKGDLLDDDNMIEGALKDGGEVDVYARYSIGHGKKYMRISYGFTFDINGKSTVEDTPSTYVWVLAHGGVFQDAWDESLYVQQAIKFDMVTSAAEESAMKVEKKVLVLLQKVLGNLLDAKVALDAKQRNTVKLLSKSLATGKVALPQ